jgi:hypothetical protein
MQDSATRKCHVAHRRLCGEAFFLGFPSALAYEWQRGISWNAAVRGAFVAAGVPPALRSFRMWYNGAIMMAKTQITLESEMQRRARQRASDLGVSLAEYFRRLVARDLTRPETAAPVDRVFDLGHSGRSDVAAQKDSMIAAAFRSRSKKARRR